MNFVNWNWIRVVLLLERRWRFFFLVQSEALQKKKNSRNCLLAEEEEATSHFYDVVGTLIFRVSLELYTHICIFSLDGFAASRGNS